MTLFSEQEQKIFSDVLLEVLSNTNISRSSPGSKMRSLIESVSKKMGKMWQQFDLNVGQAFIDGAHGKYLDFIGDIMGIGRLGEEAAWVSAQDRNIKFYVNVGTFGDINGGSSIIIPAGTIISTGEGASGILYRVTVNTLLDSANSEGYLSVESASSGTGSNVGSKQLKYHNFNNYVDFINDTLKVVNDNEILTGQDIENDANYRFRISNQLLSRERANEVAIRIAALSVPGIADILILPYFRGIGTYDILLKSVTPNISQSLIDAAQLTLTQVTAAGIFGIARGPVEVGVSLIGTITARRKLSTQEETDLLNQTKINISNYINSLDIGQDLIINELVERTMATSDLIKNIGSANQPFDKIYLYKPSSLEDNKIRETLISDYVPQFDERILVENKYAGSSPILFRIAV